MEVFLQPIRLGDRARHAPGWLIVYEGAVRGILSQGEHDEVILTVACDRRIQMPDFLAFPSLAQARPWLAQRLTGRVVRRARSVRPVTRFSARSTPLLPSASRGQLRSPGAEE